MLMIFFLRKFWMDFYLSLEWFPHELEMDFYLSLEWFPHELEMDFLLYLLTSLSPCWLHSKDAAPPSGAPEFTTSF